MGYSHGRSFVRVLMTGVGLSMIAASIVGLPDDCTAQTVVRNQYGRRDPSLTESISSSVKKGVDGIAEMVAPKPNVISEKDPVSLSTKATPSAKLYLAVARLFEESGKLADAQKQYQNALRQEPTNLAVLLGYARLKDRLGQPKVAMQLYLNAAKAHPNDPSVHNNLALLHARHGRLDAAVASLQKAIQLQPRAAKYRNNMATILVEMGRANEALPHLRAVHDEPVANYNLGYLLEKQGNRSAALRYFAVALSADPTLTPARRAVDRLAGVSKRSQQSVAAQRVEPQPVRKRVGPPEAVRPPREQVSRMRPTPPNTPPSPPPVHLPPAPRGSNSRLPQVALPEPAPRAGEPKNVAKSAQPRLESPGKPVTGSRVALPQMRLLPPPPSGYEQRSPLPKAAGAPTFGRAPNAEAPKRLPPTSRSLPIGPQLPNATAPLPTDSKSTPPLHHLPPVR